jgi:hypothetical protein
VGQVLYAAGDPGRDLMVVLEGEVEASDTHEGRRRPIVVFRPRDFIAELGLLTGQRAFTTCVVTQAGCILRIPRRAVEAVIEADGALGELLVQTMFRRRELLLMLGAGVQIVGSRYSPDTQRLREFAARNRLAYAWVDFDTDPGAPPLLRSLGLTPRETPVVLLGGAGVLVNPSNAELVTAAGIAEEPHSGAVFDLLVVGAGPAGLAAAVYGATEGLSTAVVDAVAAGGQASTTSPPCERADIPALLQWLASTEWTMHSHLTRNTSLRSSATRRGRIWLAGSARVASQRAGSGTGQYTKRRRRQLDTSVGPWADSQYGVTRVGTGSGLALDAGRKRRVQHPSGSGTFQAAKCSQMGN